LIVEKGGKSFKSEDFDDEDIRKRKNRKIVKIIYYLIAALIISGIGIFIYSKI